MRVPAVSVVSKIMIVAVVGLLACALMPLGSAFAEGEEAPSALLASSLMDGSASVVHEDVTLAAPEDDVAPEPVIGSFTFGGFTFAVIDESHVELVGVAPSVILSAGSKGPGVEESNSDQASEAGVANLTLPETINYDTTAYTLASIAPYAFYLSGVTSVTLPASVSDVDDRAFRSSDVASVTVADGNPTYSSFDGVLYDADQSSLLLIPEGKQGTVRIPKTAEVAEASVFSHCPLVDSISVDAGSAAFASENGLLYTSDLTTLLRVPAGATEITIRDGCATIAAGAMEACANLTTINAPASVTSISPDVFHAIPTVCLPAASLTEDAPQISAMVALSSTDDGLPEVDASSIELVLPGETSAQSWRAMGLVVADGINGEVASEAAATPSAIIAQDVSLEESGRPAAPLGAAYGPTIPNTGTMTFTADGPYLFLSRNDGEDDSWTQENQGVRKIVVEDNRFATNHSTACQWNGDHFIFGWWNQYDEPGTERINYVIRAKRAGYTPNQVTGTLNIGAGDFKEYTLKDGGQYIISGWTKKPSHKITLDPGDDGTGTHELYYWPDMGYTPDSSSRDVINTTTAKYAGKPTANTGKVFNGYWSQASGGIQYIDKDGNYTSNLPKEVSGDTTWYAQYVNATSTVSFNANGGMFGTVTTSSSKVTAIYGSAMPTITSTSPASTVPIPEREGWDFTGYYDGADKNATQYYKLDASDDTVSSNRSWDKTDATVTLYAHWTPIDYRIKLIAKGGSVSGLDWNQVSPGVGDGTLYDRVYTVESDDIILPTPSLTGYTFTGWTGSNGTTPQTSVTIAKGTTGDKEYTANYALSNYTITLDTQGGSVSDSSWKAVTANSKYTKSYNIESDKIELPKPSRQGYYFKGWSGPGLSSPQTTVVIDKGSTASRTYTANWGDPGTITIHLAEDLASKAVFKYMRSSNGVITGNAGGNYFQRPMQASSVWPVGRDQYGITIANSQYLVRDGMEGTKDSVINLYNQGELYDVAYYRIDGGEPIEPGANWLLPAIGEKQKIDVYVTQGTACKVTWDANGGTLEDDGGAEVSTRTDWVGSASSYPTPIPIFKGFACTGWYTDPIGGDRISSAGGPMPTITPNATFYAHWTPAISVDVPIEVTAEVDLLGIEDQVPASGYIESRCGAPLAVEEVSFTALPGAADLFGAANTASVSLQALALEGDASWDASAPTFSFPLSANATESDASKLAAFRMEGYEDHIPIGYRFAIPDDVLAAIDPTRFENVTTPVCSVSYTVALA